ncbi:MAG: DUF1540 domain-containing protein [Oligoflexia bacterium]|nr:DUF1540 domain-containing protein [Oligoflexia bacterium]
MQKMNPEMPQVSKCSITQCAYNVGQGCRAKAITIGDSETPACDTHLPSSTHTRQTTRIAGVGACKVAHCKYNDDFECSADSIAVGFAGSDAHCLTFAQRKSAAA